MNYENGATTIDGMKPGQHLDANESVANETAATTVVPSRLGASTEIEDPESPSPDSSEGSITPPKPSETVIGIDPKNVSGSARFVRVGASIMIFFESLYLLADRSSLAGFQTIVFPLHLFIFASLIGYAVVARSRVGTRHRQAVVLVTCLIIFAATAGLAISTGNDEFLVLTLMIVLVGSSALVAWGGRWQAMLSFASLGTMAAWSLWAPVADPQAAIHWAAVCAAAAYAQLTAWVGERYRTQLEGRFKELYESHQRLLGEISEREAAVSASEVSNERLRESEAKLRKIFATSVDAITITRLSDGIYIDLNEGFSRWAGFSREEVVGKTAGGLGIWAKRSQLRQFIDMIEATGAVTNFECEVLSKGGVLLPCLTSATVVELGGEACVVAIARDITVFKQNERDLIAAREAMRAQIESLERTEALLRTEIVEREAAVAASETAHRLLTESEAKLRKIFETSSDLIAINRVGDGRYVDVNDAYRTLGYVREEMLVGSADALGIWANRAQLRECMKMLASGRPVVNLEIDLRAKNGRIVPFLISAKIIELGGEACVVSIGRDITTIKETQRELIRAREAMRGQIASLERTEGLLRREIVEREATVAANERTHQQLRESEAKLRKIFATSADAITINRLSDGTALELNEGFCRATGYSREEALGRTAGSLGIWAQPEQLRQFQNLLESDGSVTNFECEVRTKSGGTLAFLSSATVIELGGERCVVAIARDITTIRKTQIELMSAREQMALQVDALQEGEKRLRAEIAIRELAQVRASESAEVLLRIFDATHVGIAITRVADGRFLRINRAYAEILGYTCEELLLLKVRQTGMVANRAYFRQFLIDLEESGSIPDIEIEVRSRDGTIHPLQVSAVKLEVDGAPCYATIMVDITRRKRIEHELIATREEALAASEAKSEFLSSMSHEIRTPMNAIQGMADLLWESELNVEQRRYLETMRRNGNTLLDLINEILDLAKVESGRLHLEQIPIDLRDLMERLLETLAPRAHEKGLELIGRIVPGTPMLLLSDPLRLRQILFNLIGNAIKFTQVGEIELTVEQITPQSTSIPPTSIHQGYWHSSGGEAPVWIRMTVRDTGIGISPEQSNSIFSSFTQADSSIARKYGGSGLGLTIVSRLVELMGGTIAVESIPGTGSSFAVTIPLEAPTAEDEAIESEAPLFRPDALAGLRVLVVDDVASCRVPLREILEEAGATVEECSAGQEAIVKLNNINTNIINYNVLLLDERMPGLDGIETVHRIAQGAGKRAASAIILMLTTAALGAEPERMEQIRRESGSECRYLMKPIKRSDLLGAVMEITGRGMREKSRADYGGQNTNSSRGTNPATAPEMADLRPLRILLADDSPDNRMLIDAYMKKAPYKVDHAEDGSIAVEKIKANHYDLVLMDIQMPVMDGYTAVRTIREWERAHGLPRMPIIALTASALDESVQRSLDAGCDAHVSKPVKRTTLFEVIIKVTQDAVELESCDIRSPATFMGGNIKRQLIRVDADLRDLVPGFLAHKRADVGTILAAIDQADYETISKIGHKMKGEGGSYGFDAVTTMGATLEQAALDKDLAVARDTLGEFTAYLESVEVVYS